MNELDGNAKRHHALSRRRQLIVFTTNFTRSWLSSRLLRRLETCMRARRCGAVSSSRKRRKREAVSVSSRVYCSAWPNDDELSGGGGRSPLNDGHHRDL